MNKREVGSFALCAMLIALGFPAKAQQPAKVPTIGVLYAGYPFTAQPMAGAFRQGLKDLGYVEGMNIAILSRYAEGKVERMTDLANELVRLKVQF